MRRFIGPVLVGLGAFLLVSAVLLKFYAYPQLAIAPIDRNSVTQLEATDATVFDTFTLSEIQTDLTVATTTRGDVEASKEAGGDIRVWTGSTTIKSGDGIARSRSIERAAFDGVSGEAVNCCDNFSETTEGDRVAVTREGLIYKFPFDTQKKDYPFWDATLRAPVTAAYQEEGEVKGLKVYIFTTESAPTVVGTREVPGSVVGEDGDVIDADVVYSNSRTLYVEPVTGGIVDREENQKSTLAVDGKDRVTTTEATLRYTDAQVVENVDDLGGQASQLGFIKTLGPLLALLLGLLAVAGGVLLARRFGYDTGQRRATTIVDA